MNSQTRDCWLEFVSSCIHNPNCLSLNLFGSCAPFVGFQHQYCKSNFQRHLRLNSFLSSNFTGLAVVCWRENLCPEVAVGFTCVRRFCATIPTLKYSLTEPFYITESEKNTTRSGETPETLLTKLGYVQ